MVDDNDMNQNGFPILQDGITRYIGSVKKNHDDYHAEGLDNLYKVESNHFWFKCRRKKIVNFFKKYINTHQNIIEIGSGTGSVSRALVSAGYKPAVGELHLSGLYYAKTYGIKDLYQFDLFSPPFLNEFECVGMFDVLEHLEEDALAIKNVAKMLKPKGLMILTVPAHNWLWNRDDKIAGHKRRYSKETLVSVVESSGFSVLEVRYFFIFILPLLWLRTVVNSDNNKPVTDEEYNIDIKINPFINWILLVLCDVEENINKYLPNIVGGSLILIAEKED
jgi:SAM-dependent methyltransferase